jgi:hypothetical protein
MKTVAMVVHDFPPEGNAGVYRPLRFVRTLPNFGWHPTVISLATDHYERYDAKLLAMIPTETTILRVPNRDPWQRFQQWRAKRMKQTLVEAPAEASRINAGHQKTPRSSLRELVRNLEACIYHPDPEMGWIGPAVKATLRTCTENRPDVIWATAAPVSSFAVARRVSERTGIPYVLDFRDSWTITYNEFEDRRPTWAQQYEHRRMYRLIQGAKSVVFRFRAEAECYWRAYEDALEASKIYIIPNGYEGRIGKFEPPKRQKCQILYTGTLSDYRYDTLLQALRILKKSRSEAAEQLHFHFVGEGADSLLAAAVTLGISDMVTTQGSISHEEVTNLSKQAHALLILGRPATMRGYELFAAAKLFGYLKLGMPIIGVLPQDETKNVLSQLDVHTVADVDCIPEIIAVLCSLREAWCQGRLPSLLPKPSGCKIYSAEYQTDNLVRALEGRPASEPFVPGTVNLPASLRYDITKRAAEFKQRKAAKPEQDLIMRFQA